MSQNPNPSRDSDYYAARSVEERRLAMACSDPKARAIHLQLAEKYAEVARTGRTDLHQVIGEGQRAG